jgi:hypothetical protein
VVSVQGQCDYLEATEGNHAGAGWSVAYSDEGKLYGATIAAHAQGILWAVPVELGKGQNYSQGEHRISCAQKVPSLEACTSYERCTGLLGGRRARISEITPRAGYWYCLTIWLYRTIQAH